MKNIGSLVHLCKGLVNTNMQRPTCLACNQNPSAINYVINGRYHFRRMCDSCIRKGKKLKPVPPAWFRSGYRKKIVCEKCGYRAKFPEKQMTVFHLDGNLRNTDSINLKTVCLNCRVEVSASKLPWRESTIIPDF
jgi:hypothetical protein